MSVLSATSNVGRSIAKFSDRCKYNCKKYNFPCLEFLLSVIINWQFDICVLNLLVISSEKTRDRVDEVVDKRKSLHFSYNTKFDISSA